MDVITTYVLKAGKVSKVTKVKTNFCTLTSSSGVLKSTEQSFQWQCVSIKSPGSSLRSTCSPLPSEGLLLGGSFLTLLFLRLSPSFCWWFSSVFIRSLKIWKPHFSVSVWFSEKINRGLHQSWEVAPNAEHEANAAPLTVHKGSYEDERAEEWGFQDLATKALDEELGSEHLLEKSLLKENVCII